MLTWLRSIFVRPKRAVSVDGNTSLKIQAVPLANQVEGLLLDAERIEGALFRHGFYGKAGDVLLARRKVRILQNEGRCCTVETTYLQRILNRIERDEHPPPRAVSAT